MRRYGCIKDSHSPKDWLYRNVRRIGQLPEKASLREYAVESLDQGNLGSCTGFGYVHAIACLTRKRGSEYTPLSPLMAYLNGRMLEDSQFEDSGAMIRDTVKGAIKWGVAHDSLWPYDITRFAEKPPQEVYDNAEKHQLLQYHRCIGIDDVKAAIAEGYPVIYGFDVYTSFDDPENFVAETGLVPVPNKFFEEQLGGHCNVFLGYDDDKERLESQNSYGPNFGDKGFLHIPYRFFSKSLVSDCWALVLGEEM